jgi:hypothetical protein
MRAVTIIEAAVFSGVGACRIAQRLIKFIMLTSVSFVEFEREAGLWSPGKIPVVPIAGPENKRFASPVFRYGIVRSTVTS